MKKKWFQYVGVQAAMVIAWSSIVVAAMNIWHTRSALVSENIRLSEKCEENLVKIDDLRSELSNKQETIQRLETQLTPFKTIALDKFTGNEDERLRKLAHELKNIQKDVLALREFSDMAKLNALGKPFADGDLEWHTPISKLLEGTWEKKDGGFSFRKDTKAESVYREVIEKYPRFPFSYYLLSLSLYSRKQNEWKVHAKKAVEILEMTTTIAGHHHHHDEVLKKLYELLGENE